MAGRRVGWNFGRGRPGDLSVNSSTDLEELAHRGYRFALSLTHDETRAEDLLQDGWFAVLKAGGPWSRPYLFATIRNRFIDQYRRDRLINTTSLNEESCEAVEIDGEFWNGDSAFSGNGTLESALGRLRPEERAVLYLAAVENYTAKQIGELLGWPRGSVLSLLHRARGKLRKAPEVDSRE